MVRRLPFALAFITGLVMLGVTLGTSQLDAARAGDELLEGAAPLLSDDGLSTIAADLERIDATFAQLTTDPEFVAEVESNPTLSEAAGRLPEARAVAGKVTANLQQRQDEFDSAVALPGLGLDLFAAVVGALVLAGIALLAGGIGLIRPTRWAAIVVLVAGGAVAGTPLVLGHVAKAQDTDALLDSLRPFSKEKVEARQHGLADVRLVFDAYDGTAVPAADLTETAAAIDRFAGLVDFSAEIQPLLVEATTMSATTTIGVSIGEGSTLAIAGAAGLVVARRRRTDPDRPDRSRPGQGEAQYSSST